MVDAILLTLRNTWSGYVDALRLVIPRLLAMASVIVAGWLIAAAARAVTACVPGSLRLGRLAERTGAAELLRKAELPPADRLAASVIFWLLFLGFLLAGFDALGFETLETLRGEVSRLVPRLVASLAILAAGLVLASMTWRVVLLAAVNAGWPSARLASGTVHALYRARSEQPPHERERDRLDSVPVKHFWAVVVGMRIGISRPSASSLPKTCVSCSAGIEWLALEVPMKRSVVTCVVCAAALLAWTPLAGSEEGKDAKAPTLYQRLGGYDKLAAIFDDVAPRLATDPQFARFFSGHATDSDLRQRQRLLELLCQESGGPCAYTGRALKTAHAGLGIAGADWTVFLKHLSVTLDHLKVGEPEKGEVLSMVTRYKADVVEKP